MTVVEFIADAIENSRLSGWDKFEEVCELAKAEFSDELAIDIIDEVGRQLGMGY